MNFTLMGFKNPSTGLTRDTYRAKLMGLFQLSPLSEEKLAGQISQVTDGGYSITEEDQRQREERAALSQRARDIVVNTVVGMELDPNAQGFDGNKQRSFKTFLDYSGAPGAEKKNAQLHRLFTGGTPQEQKEYILRNLRESPYAHLTLEQANSMSDREVVDSFQKMLPLFFMLGEIDHMLSSGGYLPFTPGEKEFLLGLKPTQDAIGLLQGRMNMIANPYYEIFHYERFTKVHAAEAEAMYSNAVKGYARSAEDGKRSPRCPKSRRGCRYCIGLSTRSPLAMSTRKSGLKRTPARPRTKRPRLTMRPRKNWTRFCRNIGRTARSRSGRGGKRPSGIRRWLWSGG